MAVLGVDEFVLRALVGEFIIRVRRWRSTLTLQQLRVADRVAFALQAGIEASDPEVLAVARRLEHALSSSFRGAFSEHDESFEGGPFADSLAASLREALKGGLLVVEERPRKSLTDRREESKDEIVRPARPRESADTFFEVRLVDEVGQAITGIPVQFTLDEEFREVTSNAAGAALVEHVFSAGASVSITDHSELDKVLDQRWETLRPGHRRKEGNTTEFVYEGGVVGAVAIKAAVSNTLVFKPPLGLLFVELWDKSGRVRHVRRKYSINGPAKLAGITDEEGRLRHESVPLGDYEVTLTIDADSYDVPADVLEPSEAGPQIRFVGAVPRVVVARLKGLFFETNKSFVLPAILQRFGRVRELYSDNNPSELLIVGHTDTTAQPSLNDPLSLERADCTAAYLLDDVDAWLKMYETSTPEKRRWGSHEDLLMIETMPDFGTKAPSDERVRWYQRTRALTVDGEAGKQTRTALVAEYMALDGTPLKDNPNFDIKITTHGCGENFPIDDGGDALDAAPADQKEDAPDRRVELYFFDAEFGILPPPPGKNSVKGSTQYPEWRDKAVLVHDLDADQAQGLVLEWSEDLDEELPDDVLITASQDGVNETIPWADGDVDDDYRRFVFAKIGRSTPVTLTAASERIGVSLTLWDQQVLSDPENPPTFTRWLEEMVGSSDPDGSIDAAGALAAVSDAANSPGNLEGDMFS